MGKIKTSTMALLIYLPVLLLIIQCKKEGESFLTIPDDNFRNALIENGVDTNGDGLISKAEALQVNSMEINRQNISKLDGIQEFENLVELDCSANNLFSLDVSNLSQLNRLYCFGNKISTLDVSNNKSLKYLYCYVNPITKLELSNMDSLTVLECQDCELELLDIENCRNLSILFTNNTSPLRPYKNKLTSLNCSGCESLKILLCTDNQIQNLHISDCILLENIECGGNKLESLNISKNTNLISSEINRMPTLNEVCVWEMPFPPEGLTIDTTDSPNVYFTMNCSD